MGWWGARNAPKLKRGMSRSPLAKWRCQEVLSLIIPNHVVPEINGYLARLRTSREFVANNREYFNRAREAVMAKITENPAAAAALTVTKSPLLAASSSNVPDLNQAPDRLASR